MYYIRFNVPDQIITIEKNGGLVASRVLPTQQCPNPGKEALLALPGNQEAFNAICDLVAFVNSLPGVLAENTRLREITAALEPSKIPTPPVV